MVGWGVEGIAPTLAAMLAGTVQLVILFPLQKFVLLGEMKTNKEANNEGIIEKENN